MLTITIIISKPIYSHRSNMCCPRECVSRHNGGTSGAPLKPLRDDSAFRALSTLTQSLEQQMLNATVGTNDAERC